MVTRGRLPIDKSRTHWDLVPSHILTYDKETDTYSELKFDLTCPECGVQAELTQSILSEPPVMWCKHPDSNQVCDNIWAAAQR